MSPSKPVKRRAGNAVRARGPRRAPGAVRKRVTDGVSHVTPAGGNVFADLGFPPAEAENLKLRSQLMTALLDRIAKRGLTQVQAARLFDVAQSRISDLSRGRIDRFTVDALVNMLANAGVKVRMLIGRPAT